MQTLRSSRHVARRVGSSSSYWCLFVSRPAMRRCRPFLLRRSRWACRARSWEPNAVDKQNNARDNRVDAIGDRAHHHQPASSPPPPPYCTVESRFKPLCFRRSSLCASDVVHLPTSVAPSRRLAPWPPIRISLPRCGRPADLRRRPASLRRRPASPRRRPLLPPPARQRRPMMGRRLCTRVNGRL